jgi:hypothetical protein
MKRNWQYQDIIDLEFFLRQDADQKGSALHSRDRQIYLRQVELQGQNVPVDPSALMRLWLQARKDDSQNPTTLPGSIAREAHALLRLVLIISGLITGGSAGLVFFNYAGATPVNVLHFLVLFVFTQLLFALIVLLRGGLFRLGFQSLPPTLSTRLMAVLTKKISSYLLRQTNKTLTADKRLSLSATRGQVKATNATYGHLLSWPLFQLIQLLTIGFNIGLLGSTFLKVTVSDIAFGWQSTLQFSSQSLYTFVSWMALPWSWLFAEGTAYPTLAEVEGSRIILKEGIAHLQTPDLISWWPFLLLSLLVYGLFFRLLLYCYGIYNEYRSANTLRFDTPLVRQVMRRMQTPIVSTQAQPEFMAHVSTQESEQADEITETELQERSNPVHLLLPDEICDQCDTGLLAGHLSRRGLNIHTSLRFMVDYESDQQLLEKLTEENWTNSAGIVILMEAWMPPLVSFQIFLKELRSKVGSSLPLTLLLVGKPSPTSVLTPVQDETLLTIWQQKMESLGDPYLELDVLLEEDNS